MVRTFYHRVHVWLLLSYWTSALVHRTPPRVPVVRSQRLFVLGDDTAGDRIKNNVKSAAAGALAGGLIAGPVGAVLGFAVGDMLAANNKGPTQPSDSIDPAAMRLYKQFSDSLKEAKATEEMQQNLLEQRRTDLSRITTEMDKLYELAKESVVNEREQAARAALEQRLSLKGRSDQIAKIISEEEARMQSVQASILSITDKMRELETNLLRAREGALREGLEAEDQEAKLLTDVLEEKFRMLERERDAK